jgi:YegS/Rv2252/BmrU family lipid kinase
MPATSSPRILVILNPAAGQADAEKTMATIESALSDAGAGFKIEQTAGEGDALEWAKSATGYDRVLVAGGDGTVMEVISGMIKNPAPVPIGILPQGTANLLSRALAIPIVLEKALALAIADGVAVDVDLGYLPDQDRYFAIVAGSGWDAQLIADASRKMKDKLGFFAYVVTGIQSLFSLKSSNVEAIIDGIPYQFRAHTLMVLNVGEIPGTPVSVGDNVSPHDGTLDLLVASNSSLWGIVKIIFRLLTKQFHGGSELRYIRASKLQLTAMPPLKLEIDGECIGEMPFSVEVVPAGIRLIVSRKYAEAKGLESGELAPIPG